MKIKVGNFFLDEDQNKIVEEQNRHILVVAGAGSGKTMTILGKLKYLINNGSDPKEILCISFTDAASKDLKRKITEDLNLDIVVMTFHKLGLEILKRRYDFDIADENLLGAIIDEYFSDTIYKDKYLLSTVSKYFKIKNPKKLHEYITKNPKKLKNLKMLISTFIHLFKANNYELDDFLAFLEDAKKTFDIQKYKREKLLLKMILNIYLNYERYLEEYSEIDFDDMLIKAKETVEKYGFFHTVKYVIVDEYQDTSKVRFDLIKSILDDTGASFMAVGDDFQSIYRFTGCDLSLFLNFNGAFEDAKTMKIENTYRNSYELIRVAGDFIMQNKAQIKKDLRSNKHIDRPIVVSLYKDPKKSLKNTVEYICSNFEGDILILGRNNADIFKFLDDKEFKIENDTITSMNNPDRNIRYLTVHKSKGLESDNVIIINMTDDLLGFPNQMKGDDILRFVSPYKSKFPYDEERRLFYVALTRTKNKVFLLIPKKSPSPFALELLKKYKKYIEFISK